jgi:hypothetical protein
MAGTKTKRAADTKLLTAEQLTELLALVKGADTVELKATIPPGDQRATTTALALDPIEAEIRQVVFFDTPSLSLNEAGVVVRARRIQGGAGDTVVKLRPVVPEQLSKKQRKSSWFGVEVDAMPGGFVCSASFKGVTDAASVRSVTMGERPIRKLFSKEQRAFLAANAPDGIALDGLATLGPITVFKLRFNPKELRRKMVAEMWMYPDYSRILELSTKCAPADALDVAAQVRGYLADRGVDLSGEQQTKTKTALEFFATGLPKQGPPKAEPERPKAVEDAPAEPDEEPAPAPA